MTIVRILFGSLFLFYKGEIVEASCYFQQAFQGEYVMQSSVNGTRVQYASLNINATWIKIWGHCHKRMGHNYILKISHGETDCLRCFYLRLRSSNVLQMITGRNALSQCHTNEEQAKEQCPTEDDFKLKNVTEILLFKTKELHGEPITKKYCPLDGKYSIMYDSKDWQSSDSTKCYGSDSAIDSCPSGSTLNIRLNGCKGRRMTNFTFECLGSWAGLKQESYLIFIDSRQKPRYRCAVYEKEGDSGRIFMALSNDSTCTTDLYNVTSGSETFLLVPKENNRWPADVTTDTCTFPEWMQGHWEHMRVNMDTLIYQDHSTFNTYTIKCAGFQEMENKYLVFSRNQCNEDHYNCMWIHKRTNNILEFQMGNKSSHTNNVFSLCHDENFMEESWITQGRITSPVTANTYSGMCPIAGEYTGVIPDSESQLCANLRSDCNAEVMYYQVSNCHTGEIYEEREYECLGHWAEENYLYTYTKRMDLAEGTYECFVGSITSNKEIFIKEAGSFCQRNIDPVKDGMQLVKQEIHSCVNKIPIKSVNNGTYEHDTITTSKPLTTRATTVAFTKTSRRPWNFDNDVGDTINEVIPPSGTNSPKLMLSLFILTVPFLIIF